MKRSKVLGHINPVDCLECKNGKSWNYGLIDCRYATTAVENCQSRRIECVRFSPRDLSNPNLAKEQENKYNGTK